jgi:hypothetical protein
MSVFLGIFCVLAKVAIIHRKMQKKMGFVLRKIEPNMAINHIWSTHMTILTSVLVADFRTVVSHKKKKKTGANCTSAWNTAKVAIFQGKRKSCVIIFSRLVPTGCQNFAGISKKSTLPVWLTCSQMWLTPLCGWWAVHHLAYLTKLEKKRKEKKPSPDSNSWRLDSEQIQIFCQIS